MPIPTADERTGTLLGGRYRIDRLLGRGGTGGVYEATHTWTGRRVALKVLHADLAADLKLVRRFLQEARAAATLAHPHVVQVLDAGATDDGTVYLAFELVDGEPLSHAVARTGRLGPAEAMSIVVPIMHGLAEAHAKGVIHRDLKPENVLVSRGADGLPDPKLVDFGMARMLESQWGRATERGITVGTPLYMSPEQARGRFDIGPETDVWSMGVLLYHVLSGAFPFEHDVPARVMAAIVQQPPRPLAEAAPDLPAPLVDAVEGALRKDPAHRHPSMNAFREALIDAARASGIVVRVTEGKRPEVMTDGSGAAGPPSAPSAAPDSGGTDESDRSVSRSQVRAHPLRRAEARPEARGEATDVAGRWGWRTAAGTVLLALVAVAVAWAVLGR